MIGCNYDFFAGNLFNLNSNLEEVVPLYGTLGQVAGQSFGAIAGNKGIFNSNYTKGGAFAYEKVKLNYKHFVTFFSN